jgi:hypothetical protein
MQKHAHFHRSLIMALLLNTAQTEQSFKSLIQSKQTDNEFETN